MSQGKQAGSWPLIGGMAAAIAASLCCVAPLVLVLMGIGGAWMAVFEPYRPLFLGVGIVFMVLAYRKIYRAPAAQDCAPGSLCALPQTNRVYKILFWVVAVVMTLALVFPYIAPLFY
jgi:mercuric ion transport protein